MFYVFKKKNKFLFFFCYEMYFFCMFLLKKHKIVLKIYYQTCSKLFLGKVNLKK